jgi:hypothetical protein
MQWSKAIGHLQHAVNEFLPFTVAKTAQCDAAAEMPVLIGVAARTTQRTLACDFDRKGGPFPFQNPAPGFHNVRSLHAESLIERTAVQDHSFQKVLIGIGGRPIRIAASYS